LFFFHGGSDSACCRQPDFITLDTGRKPLSIQVMPLVSALTAIFLHQLYSISFNFIDSTDVNAIGTDNLHMLDVLFLWCQRTRTLGIFFGC
jgi:hypothetical protein